MVGSLEGLRDFVGGEKTLPRFVLSSSLDFLIH